ncbi:hypothetical protein NM688_g5298 [Phlebia brevispora]|uniref:Uncharacterized protein n=1 Tax=Phlebia brevispora TaxID=194682 RepID=A0ACC1SXQ4_9APHY|nr:hypothetical protein NM688_g5298 [Phlebia brevispora]
MQHSKPLVLAEKAHPSRTNGPHGGLLQITAADQNINGWILSDMILTAGISDNFHPVRIRRPSRHLGHDLISSFEPSNSPSSLQGWVSLNLQPGTGEPWKNAEKSISSWRAALASDVLPLALRASGHRDTASLVMGEENHRSSL